MILYLALRLAIFVFGYLPFWLLYRISDCLSFLFYTLGIRRKTIFENLKSSFPDKTNQQINKQIKKVYKNFFDVMFVEMLKGFTISSKALAKRFDPGDLSLAEGYWQARKSMIIVLGHYANWEWGVSVAHNFNCIAFYKPIKNKYIDSYIRRNRARHQFELASINKPLPAFLKSRDKLSAYFLIADKQNVKKRHLKRIVWLPFLGKESPFLLGPEKYAKSFEYPVLYSKIKRIGRGRYQHQLISVADDPAALPAEEITKRWVSILEEQVTEDPSSWLWFWATTQSRQQHLTVHETS
jgi:KDO2-lipid IV(A) lauroyltransferase